MKERSKMISTEQLQEDLKEKDEQLMLVTRKLSKSTSQVSDLQREIADLRSEIEGSWKKFEEELSRKESLVRLEGVSEGVVRGVQLCRQRLFLISAIKLF